MAQQLHRICSRMIMEKILNTGILFGPYTAGKLYTVYSIQCSQSSTFWKSSEFQFHLGSQQKVPFQFQFQSEF
jgi:hypothetical protein